MRKVWAVMMLAAASLVGCQQPKEPAPEPPQKPTQKNKCEEEKCPLREVSWTVGGPQWPK